MDPRIEAMARTLVNYCVSVQPGEWTTVNASFAAEPLARACYEEILRAGGYPTAMFRNEDILETFYRCANDEQLAYISPLSRTVTELVDASIAILAPVNTHALAGVDPARMAIANKASEPLMETTMRRTMEGGYKWTACQFPTQAAAQDAGMSLRDYEDFVYKGGLLDQPDPPAAWKSLAERQQRIADWLGQREMIHVTGPGTDLTLSTRGRSWVNDDGHLNFPGGEVFSGPVEDSAEGTIQFTFPAFYQGREVTGVRLVFKHGRVIEASAASDEEFLLQMLDMDEGARRIGEFAFGTNPGIQRFTKNTLFDEKIGGTLHMALGRSIPQAGGQNESALHWDIVYDLRNGGEVTVDGEVFSRNGEIVVA